MIIENSSIRGFESKETRHLEEGWVTSHNDQQLEGNGCVSKLNFLPSKLFTSRVSYQSSFLPAEFLTKLTSNQLNCLPIEFLTSHASNQLNLLVTN